MTSCKVRYHADFYEYDIIHPPHLRWRDRNRFCEPVVFERKKKPLREEINAKWKSHKHNGA
jgi:hypothetical protein